MHLVVIHSRIYNKNISYVHFLEMNFIYILTVFAMAVMSTSAKPRCPIACSREADPTCGFNGSCFKIFGSPCFMENYNCEAPTRFERVAPEKCFARNGMCPN